MQMVFFLFIVFARNVEFTEHLPYVGVCQLELGLIFSFFSFFVGNLLQNKKGRFRFQ